MIVTCVQKLNVHTWLRLLERFMTQQCYWMVQWCYECLPVRPIDKQGTMHTVHSPTDAQLLKLW